MDARRMRCPATPFVIPHSVDARAPDALDQVRTVVTAPGGPWAGVQPSAVEVAAVSGGITNGLFKCSLPPTADREPVLVRVYGDKTEMFIDRAKDNATCKLLSDTGIGVPFWGLFANGRIEGYLAARPLEPSEMGRRVPFDFASAIAIETAKLHGLRAVNMPGDRSKPILWDFLDRCLEGAAAARFDAASADPSEAAKVAAYNTLDVGTVGRALAWLKRVTPSATNGLGAELLVSRAAELAASECGDAAACSSGDCSPCLRSAFAPHVGGLAVPLCPTPLAQARIDAAAVAFSVVFAHNDLLSGNVLVSDELSHQEQCSSPTVAAGCVQLIDYEYAGWNFMGYDVANHFCEHAGFEYDLEHYPARSVQHAWFRAYLHQRGAGVPTRATYASSCSDGSGPFAAGPDEEDDVSAAFLDELYTWVNRSAPLSDAFWGLWAVLQARHSPIDFDFISFAQRRLAGLHTHVREFWPQPGY